MIGYLGIPVSVLILSIQGAHAIFSSSPGFVVPNYIYGDSSKFCYSYGSRALKARGFPSREWVESYSSVCAGPKAISVRCWDMSPRIPAPEVVSAGPFTTLCRDGQRCEMYPGPEINDRRKNVPPNYDRAHCVPDVVELTFALTPGQTTCKQTQRSTSVFSKLVASIKTVFSPGSSSRSGSATPPPRGSVLHVTEYTAAGKIIPIEPANDPEVLQVSRAGSLYRICATLPKDSPAASLNFGFLSA